MRKYMSLDDKINTIKQEGNRDVIYEIMMEEIRAAPAEQKRILEEWTTAARDVKKLRITSHVKDGANELLEIIDGLQMEMEASERFSPSPSPSHRARRGRLGGEPGDCLSTLQSHPSSYRD